jgi:hypothetical protein
MEKDECIHHLCRKSILGAGQLAGSGALNRGHMSHFLVTVILPQKPRDHKEANALVEKLMAPYCEHTSVPEYETECYCVGRRARQAIRKVIEKEKGFEAIHKKWAALGVATPFIEEGKGTKEQQQAYEDELDLEQGRLEQLKAKLLAEHPWAKQARRDCTKCKGKGVYKTTYNRHTIRVTVCSGLQTTNPHIGGISYEGKIRQDSTGRDETLFPVWTPEIAGRIFNSKAEPGRAVCILPLVPERKELGTHPGTTTTVALGSEIRDIPQGLPSSGGEAGGMLCNLQAGKARKGSGRKMAGGGPRPPDKEIEGTIMHEVQHLIGSAGGEIQLVTCHAGIPHPPHVIKSKMTAGGAKWDYWSIGGRWSGAFTDYDPAKDPRNIVTCQFCNGTGKRPDMECANGCNACQGTGKEVKWPSTRGEFARDILQAKRLKKDFVSFALVGPSGRWHEREKMGWFGCSHGAVMTPAEWRKKVRRLLKANRNKWVVAVDAHV